MPEGCVETNNCCYQALYCLGYVATWILVLGCVTGEVLGCEVVMNAVASWEKEMVTSWVIEEQKGGEQVKRREVPEESE
jgi:hypothetical protein